MLRMDGGGEALSSRVNGHMMFAQPMRNCENHPKCDFMTSHPCDPGSVPDTSKDSKKTVQVHGTSKHLISEVTIFVKHQDVDEIAADVQHLRSVWGALVSRHGIYVEKHEGRRRDFFIWIRFDHRKLGAKHSPLGVIIVKSEGPHASVVKTSFHEDSNGQVVFK